MTETPLLDFAASMRTDNPALECQGVAANDAGPVPRPLGGSEGRIASYPINALGKHGSSMVEALHQKFQAPPAMCAQAVLWPRRGC